MSVVGFDVGNDTSCVALARKRGIDVLMNKESKRETPAVVNFGKPILHQLHSNATMVVQAGFGPGCSCWFCGGPRHRKFKKIHVQGPRGGPLVGAKHGSVLIPSNKAGLMASIGLASLSSPALLRLICGSSRSILAWLLAGRPHAQMPGTLGPGEQLKATRTTAGTVVRTRWPKRPGLDEAHLAR